MISTIRFFRVAPLHSRYMWLALAGVFIAGVTTLAADPSRGANVLGPLALLQMLAASSGFAVTARRGHLDLLLTAGPGRLVIALTHLLLSVLPGLLVWAGLGVSEMLFARTLQPRAFATGSVVALAAISALAWALTVRLPRLSGGIAWLLGIAVWVVGWGSGPAVIHEFAAGAMNPGRAAVLVSLCPFVLLGTRLSSSHVPVVLPVLALALAGSVAAIACIVRMDVPLESAQ